MIKAKPFKKEDLAKLQVRKEFLDPAFNLAALAAQEGGLVQTLWNGDEVGAIIGASYFWSGVVEFWAITSLAMQKAPLGYHKASVKFRDAVENGLKPHRSQITVRCDFPQANRWATALGFRWESRMQKFGADGADYNMYVRLK